MKIPRRIIIAVFIAVLSIGLFVSPAYGWQCGKYNFRITSSGSVQVENRSDNNEPAQEADVFVNGNKVINNADVPAMKAGTNWKEFATIHVPSGDWSWRVKGESDCSDSGEHEGNEPTRTPRVPTATPDPSPAHKPSATPDPTVSRPTATPDPTFTPEATETPIPPTDTPKPDPSDTPRPNPSDTPRPNPSDTPKPKPSSTPEPKLSNTPTLAPSATPSETATQIYVATVECKCFEDLEVWAYIHIDDEAKSQLAGAIALGNEPLVEAIEQSNVSVFVEAELQPILYTLVAIFAVLGANLVLGAYNSFKK